MIWKQHYSLIWYYLLFHKQSFTKIVMLSVNTQYKMCTREMLGREGERVTKLKYPINLPLLSFHKILSALVYSASTLPMQFYRPEQRCCGLFALICRTQEKYIHP